MSKKLYKQPKLAVHDRKGTVLYYGMNVILFKHYMKNSMETTLKVRMVLPHDPVILLLGIYSKHENINLKRCMYAYVHFNTKYNSQNMETIQLSNE